MSNIYDQHRAAFSSVSAYCVMKGGARVASVAFKYPRDGAGRLWCYLHVFGRPMVRGYASGGGYDKHSAAAATAAQKVQKYEQADLELFAEDVYNRDAVVEALLHDDGLSWDSHLRDVGFEVFQAV